MEGIGHERYWMNRVMGMFPCALMHDCIVQCFMATDVKGIYSDKKHLAALKSFFNDDESMTLQTYKKVNFLNDPLSIYLSFFPLALRKGR
jgi:hypothetical protein